MKPLHGLFFAAVLACPSALALAGPDKLPVKAGDSVFVCGCGQKCCELVSLKAGKCACDHDLTKVTVSKVEGDKAHYTANGKPQTVKIAGGYKCACAGDCCKIISQKAGKCACGKEMVKAATPAGEKSGR